MLYMLYKHYIDPSSDVAVAVALGYDQHNILKEVNSLNDIKDELRSRLGDYVSQVTTPSRRAGRNMFVCPLCGSGSKGGRDSDGAFHLSGDRWYCHACQKGGDIFTLYAEINQLDTATDFPEINKGLAQAYRPPPFLFIFDNIENPGDFSPGASFRYFFFKIVVPHPNGLHVVL